MRRAGGYGESRGNEHRIEGAERPIELGKAHIVANGKREPPERTVERYRTLARFEGARLVVALIAGGEAEKMHLVVARDAPPAVVDHQAGAADARTIGACERCSAADQPEAMLARAAREELLNRAAPVGLGERDFVALVTADTVEVLRQRHEPRAGGGRGGDQAAGRGQVGGELGRRNHLHGGDARLAHGVLASEADGATVSFTTLGSAQLPLTSNSCANSCPSGFLSTFCASAAATPATGLTIATAVEAVPPRLGTTRTFRSCVSCASSTCPDIVTSAAGPTMWNPRTCSAPRSMREVASMRSKRKPLEKTSRKSSAIRRGSACRFMSEISLPKPGSISRNCPSSDVSLSSPERLG